MTSEREPTVLEDLDHKRIGRLYVYFGFGFLVAGGLAGMLLRGELAEDGPGFLAAQYGRTFSLHATAVAVLAVPAIWTGLATHLIPLQIGANRVAFPRLHAAALWIFGGGGAIVLASYAADGLTLVGLSFGEPVNIGGASSTADGLWIAGMALVALASLATTVSLVSTIVTLRAPAIPLLRLPLFTWAVLVTGAVSLISIPVHLAGLILLYLDRHFGGEFFSAPGADDVWRHTLWLFGRPEIFLLTLPGLGVAAAVAAGQARRPLLGETGVRGLLAGVGALSLGAWAAGSLAADSLTAPTFSGLTALAALLPFAMVPAWAGTLATGRPRLHPSLGFVAGAVALHGLAFLNAGAAAVVGVTGGAWSTGFLHSGFFVPPLLLASAALWHWAPKLWGRRLRASAGWIAALLVTGGTVVQSGASFVLGYQGAANRTIDSGGNLALDRTAAMGAVLTVVGILLIVWEIARAAVSGPERDLADDPWGETEGLEWTVPSPPLRRNFASLPGSDPVEAVAVNKPVEDAPTEVDAELETVGAAT